MKSIDSKKELEYKIMDLILHFFNSSYHKSFWFSMYLSIHNWTHGYIQDEVSLFSPTLEASVLSISLFSLFVYLIQEI